MKTDRVRSRLPLGLSLVLALGFLTLINGAVSSTPSPSAPGDPTSHPMPYSSSASSAATVSTTYGEPVHHGYSWNGNASTGLQEPSWVATLGSYLSPLQTSFNIDGYAAFTMGATGDVAYITLSATDLVALVDTASHFFGTVDVGVAGCDFPWSATMSPDGSHVYIGCQYSGNIAIIETAGNTVVTTVAGIPSADGIAFVRDGDYALVGSGWNNQITVVDNSTYLISYISTPDAPRSVVGHPYLDRAYATCADGTILVIDTTSFSILTTIPVGSDPWDVAVSPNGQWVFAGDRQGAGLAVLDTSSNTLHTTVTGLGNLAGLAVAPDGSEIYAGSLGSGIHVIDGTSFAKQTTIPSAGNAWEAAVTCDGSELYVSSEEDQVLVIDTATYSVSDQIAMPGHGPRGIAICPQHVAAGVFLGPSGQTNSGALGQIIAHPEVLVNATGATDSFTVTLGSYVWDTVLSTEGLGPIAHRESTGFTVYVTVPLGADWYATDTVVVTATSVASPTVYSDTAVFTTEAYAPPQISVSPRVLSSTQYVNGVAIETLMISNGNGVTAEFAIDSGPKVSFLAASTELYGYGLPGASLRIIGTENNTHVRVIDLDTSNVIAENPDLDRYDTWDAHPSIGTYYKVEADRRVVGYASDWSFWVHATFVPSLGSGPVGREFIFYYFKDVGNFYVFAVDNASVEVCNSSGAVVASRTMSGGEYWNLSLPNDVYHVFSTGRIAMEIVAGNGYTTVPSTNGTAVGRRFYFGTDGDFSGAFAVLAYEDAHVKVYDLDSGTLVHSRQIDHGGYWWQRGVGTRRLRLESTGKVEVWAGDSEGCCGIEHLGDDTSFAGGDNGQEYYLHSLMDGSVVFAPYDNTTVIVDGTTYDLNKDEYLHLSGCCYLRHIQSSEPLLIQTLGRDSAWNDLGTYLGGVVEGVGSVPWLVTDLVSGTVATNSSTPVQVTFDATGLQPDSYTTQIMIQGNDPVTPLVSVPVTMAVLPTSNMGWVEGKVIDAATGDPLAATIVALGQPYTITTDSDTGTYTFWLDAGSHTLQVIAEGYAPESANVSIIAQRAATQDFALWHYRQYMPLILRMGD